MKSENSINESLDIIRRALEDDNTEENDSNSSKVLVLNQKVNEDGTIKLIQKSKELNKEINDIIDEKLNYLVENRIEKVLDEKIPKILKTYFESK
ncbi:MAG: hypothetical protein ACJ0RJ_04200 [Alphaproteobacteria bacterium]|tara:strand:- start:98 stop:382 length:285 start_codon:yes stop_codon:yes gene_type:complete